MNILENTYLKEQLITYIGNKRRLLPLIHSALEKDLKANMRFLDLFSGSGVVSRLGRLMGARVISNDWEEYSRVLAESHLRLNSESIPRLFGSRDKLIELLDHLNNLKAPREEDQYMSLYYAPAEADVELADFRKERLFYTRENALRIDGIRGYIETHYPVGISEETDQIRYLFIGLLLCEASKHTNTSGVFKAFHKGFGGHGKDALSRILKAIELKYPVLPSQCPAAELHCRDANELVKELPPVDIAYLDPPYNQHQYGSNYHILNSIALWDRIPAPLTLNEKGLLKEKAAIRKDWTKTRSSYCYRKKASPAFRELMDDIDARKILISYSNDGIIPFEEMLDICESRGNLDIISNEYSKYRGGRQSNQRLHKNIEFILSVDTRKSSTATSRRKIHHLLLLDKVRLMSKSIYREEPFLESFSKESHEQYSIILHNKKILCELEKGLFLSFKSDLSQYSSRVLKTLSEILERCSCSTRKEEIEEILNQIRVRNDIKLLKQIPARLRMLAHRKNRDDFYDLLKKVEDLRSEVDLSSIDRPLVQIKMQAEKRMRE